MRKISITLAGVIALITLGACDKGITPASNAEDLNLNGKVKSMTEVVVHEDYIDTTFYQFDEKGYFTEAESRLTHFYEGDTLSDFTKRVYTYPDAHTIKIVGYDAEGKEVEKWEQKLNEKGMLTEIEMVKDDGRNIHFSYTYTNGGRKGEILGKLNGTAFSKSVVTYNDKGRILSEEVYHEGSPDLINRRIHTYNEKGFEASVENESFFPKSKNISTYQYEYDAQGSATEIKIFVDGELISTSKRTIKYY